MMTARGRMMMMIAVLSPKPQCCRSNKYPSCLELDVMDLFAVIVRKQRSAAESRRACSVRQCSHEIHKYLSRQK